MNSIMVCNLVHKLCACVRETIDNMIDNKMA